IQGSVLAVVRRKYKRRGRGRVKGEVRRTIEAAAGSRSDKTSGRAPRMRSGANPGFSATATTWYGQDPRSKPTQPKRRAAPVVEQHGFFASGYAVRNTLARVAVPCLPPRCCRSSDSSSAAAALKPAWDGSAGECAPAGSGAGAGRAPGLGTRSSSLAATGRHLALEADQCSQCSQCSAVQQLLLQPERRAISVATGSPARIAALALFLPVSPACGLPKGAGQPSMAGQSAPRLPTANILLCSRPRPPNSIVAGSQLPRLHVLQQP
ncbi:hypothetical protein J1614_007436, partial [Plenodomus biglobosus]